jgi:hypothetical protein
MRFLKIIFYVDSEAELDHIYDYMRTTVEEDQIVTEAGETFIQIEDDADLVNELLCLGGCLHELDEAGYDNPFYAEIVHLDEAPVDIDAAPVYKH